MGGKKRHKFSGDLFRFGVHQGEFRSISFFFGGERWWEMISNNSNGDIEKNEDNYNQLYELKQSHRFKMV